MLCNKCPKRMVEMKDNVCVRLFSAYDSWHKMHLSYWHKVDLPFEVQGHKPNVHTQVILADPLTAITLYDYPIKAVDVKSGNIISITVQKNSFADVIEVPTWLYGTTEA